MLELRKDYVLPRWIIISEKRGARPKQFKKIKVEKKGFCFFCLGNENTTPTEIGRIQGKDGKWKIRWFPNKFPAVQKKGNPKLSKKGIYEGGSAYGYHEVITETNDHKKQIADLSTDHIKDILKVYAIRIKELSKKKGIKYVLIFRNEGVEGGTSLIHSHTQVVAYNKIPELVKEEAKLSIKNKKCEYCKIIKKEAKSKRKAFENKNFIAICPYASRYNYEVWIFPKKHLKNITEFDEDHFNDLADIFSKILKKVSKITESYNFFIHYSPKGKNLHFHIEICPRIATWAGFELGSNETINSVSPKTAAKYYKTK